MEKRFENKYVRDESTAREIYKYWFFKKPTMSAVYAILAVYALACIFGLGFDFDDAREFIFPFILAVMLPVLMIISYRSQVKTMVNRDKEMAQGGELVCEVSVSDNEIALCARESRNSILIADVKYAFVTENYIAVITNARLMLILKKDSFTLGDTDGFISFLKEKGIKVKGQKK